MILDALSDHEELPFPPGDSPFRVRGIFHRGNLDFIASSVPGGIPAALAALRSPRLRAFFGQTFVADSWYDVFPLVASSQACARLCGKSTSDYVRMRSRYQAQSQGALVDRSILDLSSSSATASRLPLLASHLYNFGTAEARDIGPRMVELTRGGLPADLMSWYIPSTEAYMTAALELRGAKNPRASTSVLRVQGRQFGLTVGSVTHTLTWDAWEQGAPE